MTEIFLPGFEAEVFDTHRMPHLTSWESFIIEERFGIATTDCTSIVIFFRLLRRYLPTVFQCIHCIIVWRRQYIIAVCKNWFVSIYDFFCFDDETGWNECAVTRRGGRHDDSQHIQSCFIIAGGRRVRVRVRVRVRNPHIAPQLVDSHRRGRWESTSWGAMWVFEKKTKVKYLLIFVFVSFFFVFFLFSKCRKNNSNKWHKGGKKNMNGKHNAFFFFFFVFFFFFSFTLSQIQKKIK